MRVNEAPQKGLATVVTRPAALAGDPDMRVVYVRRKPARGLVALHAGPRAAGRMACVSVDESMLRESGANARATLRWFPDDPELRALAVCCDPSTDPQMWEALERAASRVAGSRCRLLGARAEPLRYKPHDRCLLRYHLELCATSGRIIRQSVIAKAYHEPDEARRVHDLAEQLARQDAHVVPTPLGVIEHLGVALAEDVSASLNVDGTLALRPGFDAMRPHRALQSAAAALAVFHACSPRAGCAELPTTREVAKVLERAELLAHSVPSAASRLRRTGRLVADALAATRCSDPRLLHGSFKPSQLLFGAGARVVVTDLDHCHLGDPALDLGYFLAYLRPASLWHGSAAARAWYVSAANRFRDAYVGALAAAGAPPQDARSALARAPIYESALLLKIATRRAHRLNSPRPRELEAILRDIARCLDAASEPLT
jgi:aminoglycoside phosphotransferase (APT) family kinase protein